MQNVLNFNKLLTEKSLICWYAALLVSVITWNQIRATKSSDYKYHLEQPAGQRGLSALSTFRQRLKHFCSRPRSLTLSLILGKLFPTSSGSWSDFITWTTLKIHDWLIDSITYMWIANCSFFIVQTISFVLHSFISPKNVVAKKNTKTELN